MNKRNSPSSYPSPLLPLLPAVKSSWVTQTPIIGIFGIFFFFPSAGKMRDPRNVIGSSGNAAATPPFPKTQLSVIIENSDV